MIFGVIVILTVLLFAAGLQIDDQVFEGRRISSWYKDLCTGVFGGTPRAAPFQAAYNAFARMGPTAVPYLTRQLKYGRSGYLEKFLLRLRTFDSAIPLVDFVILPSSRRCYAAVALREMRGSAESAVPALLEAWARDTKDVKVNAISALAAILYGQPPSDMIGSDWDSFSAKVIADAIRKCPDTASSLRLAPDPVALSSSNGVETLRGPSQPQSALK